MLEADRWLEKLTMPSIWTSAASRTLALDGRHVEPADALFSRALELLESAPTDAKQMHS